jgi:hypothetical protein
MPWAAYVVGASMIILCIPYINEMLGVIFLTFGAVPVAIALSSVQAPLTAAGFTPSQVNWAAIGLAGLIWLGIIAVVARSFIHQEEAKQDSSGALNALILIVGLPMCSLMSVGVLQGFHG